MSAMEKCAKEMVGADGVCSAMSLSEEERETRPVKPAQFVVVDASPCAAGDNDNGSVQEGPSDEKEAWRRQLLAAASAGDGPSCERLISQRPADVGACRGPDRETPLHVLQVPTLVALFVDAGVDVEARNVADQTALQVASRDLSLLEVCIALVEAGARIQPVNNADCDPTVVSMLEELQRRLVDASLRSGDMASLVRLVANPECHAGLISALTNNVETTLNLVASQLAGDFILWLRCLLFYDLEHDGGNLQRAADVGLMRILVLAVTRGSVQARRAALILLSEVVVHSRVVRRDLFSDLARCNLLPLLSALVSSWKSSLPRRLTMPSVPSGRPPSVQSLTFESSSVTGDDSSPDDDVNSEMDEEGASAWCANSLSRLLADAASYSRVRDAFAQADAPAQLVQLLDGHQIHRPEMSNVVRILANMSELCVVGDALTGVHSGDSSPMETLVNMGVLARRVNEPAVYIDVLRTMVHAGAWRAVDILLHSERFAAIHEEEGDERMEAGEALIDEQEREQRGKEEEEERNVRRRASAPIAARSAIDDVMSRNPDADFIGAALADLDETGIAENDLVLAQRGLTLSELVGLMTSAGHETLLSSVAGQQMHEGYSFADCVLLTHATFVDSVVLLRMLRFRFGNPFTRSPPSLTQRYVVRVLILWVERFSLDFSISSLLTTELEAFCNGILVPASGEYALWAEAILSKLHHSLSVSVEEYTDECGSCDHNYLYYQCRDSVLNERLPCTEAEAAILAALQGRVEMLETQRERTLSLALVQLSVGLEGGRSRSGSSSPSSGNLFGLGSSSIPIGSGGGGGGGGAGGSTARRSSADLSAFVGLSTTPPKSMMRPSSISFSGIASSGSSGGSANMGSLSASASSLFNVSSGINTISGAGLSGSMASSTALLASLSGKDVPVSEIRQRLPPSHRRSKTAVRLAKDASQRQVTGLDDAAAKHLYVHRCQLMPLYRAEMYRATLMSEEIIKQNIEQGIGANGGSGGGGGGGGGSGASPPTTRRDRPKSTGSFSKDALVDRDSTLGALSASTLSLTSCGLTTTTATTATSTSAGGVGIGSTTPKVVPSGVPEVERSTIAMIIAKATSSEKKAPNLKIAVRLYVGRDRIVIEDERSREIRTEQSLLDLRVWTAANGGTALLLEFVRLKVLVDLGDDTLAADVEMLIGERLRVLTRRMSSHVDHGNYSGTLDDDDDEDDDEELLSIKCACPPDPQYDMDFDMDNLTGQSVLSIPEELGRQLTLIEHELFLRITPADCLRRVLRGVERRRVEVDSPGVEAFIEWFNKVSGWVTTEVVQTEGSAEDRGRVISGFIWLANACRELNNHNGVMEIVSGLNSSSVLRLKASWEAVGKTERKLFEQLVKWVSAEGNFRVYRNVLMKSETPAVPYFGMFLKDLTFLHDGNADYSIGGRVNMAKRRQVAAMLRSIQRFQEDRYNLMVVPPIRAFLRSHTVVLDENELHDRSRRLQ